MLDDQANKQTTRYIKEVIKDILDLLLTKNQAYDDAALNPINIFSNLDAENTIRVSIDHKLKRLSNQTRGNIDTEDTVKDLVGYLILLLVAQRMKGSIPTRSKEDEQQ